MREGAGRAQVELAAGQERVELAAAAGRARDERDSLCE